MPHVKYDQIGLGYNNTRKADPYLVSKWVEYLGVDPGYKVLDIGCGTGNYTIKLRQVGLDCMGMDPSTRMLSIAKESDPSGIWLQGSADQTKLDSDSLDAIMGSLTMHHWKNLELAFLELSRVTKSEGRLVFFTSTPQQMKGYWLNEYFPEMLADSIRQMPDLEQVTSVLHLSGFENVTAEKYFVTKDLQDLFLYSGKHRPYLYLEESVRNGISSFSDLSKTDEISKGLSHLASDIKTGRIQEVMKSYENNEGDYLFVSAIKN